MVFLEWDMLNQMQSYIWSYELWEKCFWLLWYGVIHLWRPWFRVEGGSEILWHFKLKNFFWIKILWQGGRGSKNHIFWSEWPLFVSIYRFVDNLHINQSVLQPAILPVHQIQFQKILTYLNVCPFFLHLLKFIHFYNHFLKTNCTSSILYQTN